MALYLKIGLQKPRILTVFDHRPENPSGETSVLVAACPLTPEEQSDSTIEGAYMLWQWGGFSLPDDNELQALGGNWERVGRVVRYTESCKGVALSEGDADPLVTFECGTLRLAALKATRIYNDSMTQHDADVFTGWGRE